MTVYLAFNEREALPTPIPSEVTSTTSSTVSLSGINRAGIDNRSNTPLPVNLSAPISEGWARVRIRGRTGPSSGDAGGEAFSVRQASGTNIAAIRQQAGDANFYVRSILDGTDVFVSEAGTYDFDIHFKIAEEGFVIFYVDGVAVHQVSGDTRFASGSQEVDNIILRSPGTEGTGFDSRAVFFSHIIVSDESTIGARVYTLPLTEGATNEWSSNVADVAGTGFAEGIDLLSSDAADQTVLFSATMPSFDTGNGEHLSALVLSNQMLAETNSPSDKIEFVYNGSATGDITSVIGDSVEPVSLILNQKPGTTDGWQVADISNTEFGMISRAV